jgi:hypothetical protein
LKEKYVFVEIIGFKDSPSTQPHYPRIRGFKGKTEELKTLASEENRGVRYLNP